MYVHVPFCVRRCGYCDFNTYTPGELHAGAAELTDVYLQAAHREIALADAVLGAVAPPRPVATVFFGGGTPTMLAVEQLAGLLEAIRQTWGVTAEVEVTTEANPDSVTPDSLTGLAEAGFTRVSFGMQSGVRSVLATLDRTHDPERIPEVVGWARDASLQVSLDLIYGTPGESVDDWHTSLRTALATGPDHVSAYSLTVEEGTAMGARVRRGRLPLPDADDQAAKYEVADDLLTGAGYRWYEVSNWALSDASGTHTDRRCRHNLGYWRSDDWWGVGPGAHSHVGGLRWWNLKHPRSYAARLADAMSPAAGHEELTAEDQRLEQLMLRIRLREGLAWTPGDLDADVVARLTAEGLLEQQNPLVLTRRGRLLADHVVRELSD